MMNLSLYRSHGVVERKKDRLVRDLKSVVADADDLLQEVGNSTAEEFAAARARVEDRLREARSRLDQARVAISRKAGDAVEATQEYARENPWKAFGIPAVAALVVFLLVSRR
jgi:ElaB/YqjD/DUF883 family membrane-anchored ribosome-binding protein